MTEDTTFSTSEGRARFLTQATFGPTTQEISSSNGETASSWFAAALAAPVSLTEPVVSAYVAAAVDEPSGFVASMSPRIAFMTNAIEGEDQLRQRMAFALSQILVVSSANEFLLDRPQAMAYYQDVLARNALGNYRDLLEEVTYAPAMGHYLTYMGNRRGDPATSRVPDENYAREILQLFTIGLVALDAQGQPMIGNDGFPVETYTNEDITGLARVFTGLQLDRPQFNAPSPQDTELMARPMAMFDAEHSALEKRFLDTVIPAGANGEASIDLALDAIFNHPNVGPFIGRQLIQRFVTSNPSGAYVGRVSTAFNEGRFILPSGAAVGDGRRGDLAATLAAILFDEEARSDAARSNDAYGKAREPVIRFVNWARAFEIDNIRPEHVIDLWDTSRPDRLAQQAYRSPSVFNFYRPGYVASGALSGEQDLVAPEFQIMDATTITGYAGFMSLFIRNGLADRNGNAFVSAEDERSAFSPDYSAEAALAANPDELLDALDLRLTYGTMSGETRSEIIAAINAIPLSDASDPAYDGAERRVQMAVLMVMTSADYIIQR